MPRKRQSELVGGFEVFKALGRAQNKVAKKTEQNDVCSGKTPQTSGRSRKPKPKMASHIGRTALPPKHELVCFECGYAFEITGKIDSIQCPKCRVEISLRNVTIDQEWREDVKTGGTIEIKRGAVVRNSDLIAKEIILDGKIVDGSINAYRRLVLMPNGTYDENLIQARDLIVAPQAKMVLKKTARFNNVDIGGSLRARKLCVEALIYVRAGGLLSGAVQAARFQLEEGGGLKAEMNINKL